MRKPLLALALAPSLVACVGSPQARRVERPVVETHDTAFGDYRQVFNTTYHVLNKYGVIQESSYHSGEITALVKEDTQLYDKTRQEIQARIRPFGNSYEVQCRVLYKVEQSEPATFSDQFHPLYDWRTVGSDPQLEVRLNNEIRSALSDGAWDKKIPLTPHPERDRREAVPGTGARPTSADDGEVSVTPRPQTAAKDAPGAEAFDRLGVARMRRGAYAGAAKAFAASLERDPAGAVYAPYLLAQALFSQGSFRSAQVRVEEGLEQTPAWIEGDLDVRDLYRDGDGTFERRLGELEAAAASDPPLFLLLGYMRLASGDSEGALAALARCPDDGAPARALRKVARGEVDLAHGLEAF